MMTGEAAMIGETAMAGGVAVASVRARHLSAGIRYQMSWRMRSVGIYLVFFLLFAVAIPVMVSVFASAVSVDGYVDAMTPAVIFSLITGMIGARSDFRFLLFNGLTRTGVFVCTVISTVLASAVTAVAAVASRLLLSIGGLPVRVGLLGADQYAAGTGGAGDADITFFSFTFSGGTSDDAASVDSVPIVIHGPGVAVMVLVTFLIILAMSSLGVLIGVVMSRLGRRGRLIAAVAVVLAPALVGFLLSRMDAMVLARRLEGFGSFFLGIGADGTLDAGPLSVTLLVLIAVFSALAWLVGRRRGVDRVVRE